MSHSPDFRIFILIAVIVVMVISFFTFALVFIFQKKLREKQKQLYESLVTSQEAEQIRIGRELHDQTSPFLSAIQHHLDNNPNEDRSYLNLLRSAITSIRSASHILSPPGLQENGLAYSVNYLIINTFKFTGISFIVNIPQNLDLTEMATLHIYRMVSELLSNAVKYAESSEIKVSLLINGSNLEFEVCDNGIGMDPTVSDYSEGLGWQSINNRLAILNGFKIIDSNANGTQVKILIPLNKVQ